METLNSDKLISVIVPIYNCEKYLKDCLLSIYNQTYQNYEIVAVNDASPDNSAEIIEHMRQQYGKLVPVTLKNNRGLSGARNAGMDNASGDYICYVDADDTIEPDYLEQMLTAAIANNADLVIGDYKEVDENLKPLPEDFVNGQELSELNKKRQTACYTDGLVSKYTLIDNISKSYLNHYSIASIVAWNKLIKADIAKANRFKEGFIHEDEFWIVQMLLSCDKIAWTSSVIYNYRMRSGSITHSTNTKDNAEERAKKAWRNAAVLDAFESRIPLIDKMTDIDGITDSKEKQKHLKKRVTYQYFSNIINQYLICYCDYKLTSKECNQYFSKRMKMALKKYGRFIDLKEYIKYVIFSFSPRKFFHYFWKKKLN